MPPPPPRTAPAPRPRSRRGRPSRRADIFAAALQLFRERGFHATSINDIGAAAGVAGTAIYSHFATKQEVLAEAIREGAGRIGSGMREAMAAEAASPEQALEHVVRGYVRVVLDNADMNACYMLESRNLEGEVRQPLLQRERSLRDAWRERLLAFRPELSGEQAQTMVQMAIFSVLALCMHRTRASRELLIDQATTFVLGALRSPVPIPSTERGPDS